MTTQMKAQCIRNSKTVAGAELFTKAADPVAGYGKQAILTNTVSLLLSPYYLAKPP